MTQLLIVEDDEKIRANLLLQLREEGFAPHVRHVGRGGARACWSVPAPRCPTCCCSTSGCRR